MLVESSLRWSCGQARASERVILQVELVEAAEGGGVCVHAEGVEVEVVRRGAHLVEDLRMGGYVRVGVIGRCEWVHEQV